MIKHLVRRTTGAAADRKGVTAAEYAVLAVGVIIIVGGAISVFGGQVTNLFNTLGSSISSAQQKATSSAPQ